MSWPMGREGLSGLWTLLISDELLLALMDQGRIFDVSKTRGWLDSRRIEVAILSIEPHQALLVS